MTSALKKKLHASASSKTEVTVQNAFTLGPYDKSNIPEKFVKKTNDSATGLTKFKAKPMPNFSKIHKSSKLAYVKNSLKENISIGPKNLVASKPFHF